VKRGSIVSTATILGFGRWEFRILAEVRGFPLIQNVQPPMQLVPGLFPICKVDGSWCELHKSSRSFG